MLRALLALQQAVLRLQHAFLRTLRPRAFRLLRLQLLHALLQPIDAGLAISGLARKHLALLAHVLLALLDTLLALLLQPADAALAFRGLARKHLARPSRPLAHGRRPAWT